MFVWLALGSVALGQSLSGTSLSITGSTALDGDLEVSGVVDLSGTAIGFGSLSADPASPGLVMTYQSSGSTAGQPSAFRLTAKSEYQEWLWERLGWDGNTSVPVIGIDPEHRLKIFSPDFWGTPVIVLDPIAGQILINGTAIQAAPVWASLYEGTEISLGNQTVRLFPADGSAQFNGAVTAGSLSTSAGASFVGGAARIHDDGTVSLGPTDDINPRTTLQIGTPGGNGTLTFGSIYAPCYINIEHHTGAQFFDINNNVDGGVMRLFGKDSIQLRTQGCDPAVVVDFAGNVGIGTTGPEARLHVGGDGRFDGGVTVGGDCQFEGGVAVNGPIRIPPAGDLAMGEFTSGPPPGQQAAMALFQSPEPGGAEEALPGGLVPAKVSPADSATALNPAPTTVASPLRNFPQLSGSAAAETPSAAMGAKLLTE